MTQINNQTHIMVSDEYDPIRCLARLSSDPTKQCKCKKPLNDLSYPFLCGKHKKMNKVYRIDEALPENVQKCTKRRRLITLGDLANKYISPTDVIYTLDYYKLEKARDNKTNILSLKHFLYTIQIKEPYTSQIIRLQSIIRGTQLRKRLILKGPGLFNRSIINNETDFLTLESIYKLDFSKFFSYTDKDGFIYAFSLESAKYILNSNMQNPYNRNIFSNECINRLGLLIQLEESIGRNLDIKEDIPISSYGKMKQNCIRIFQRMDELELYTQPRWFLDLSLSKLKTLYNEIEDIWNYRAMLTTESKQNYTKTGKAFQNKASINKVINIELLQNLLLVEFERFAFEGKTKEDCITSCYWILMGLTIVSPNAAIGCPELVQSGSIN